MLEEYIIGVLLLMFIALAGWVWHDGHRHLQILRKHALRKKADKFAKRTDYDCQCFLRGEATHFLLFRLSPGIQTDWTIKKVQ
jgi:hypothetical protein